MLVESRELYSLIERLLARHHISERDGSWIAEGLIEADLRGVETHGVRRLEAYVNGWRQGHLNPQPAIELVSSYGALSVLDGDNGLGLVVGRASMERAIEVAQEYGVGIVGARNGNHTGMLAQHVLPAAEQGMLGYFVSNGPPVMAPFGGKLATLSNNPFAVAIPATEHPHLVLDMACSAVARGRIRIAAQEDVPIPEGWAVDEEGNPTTDPHRAMLGAVLPVAGYKGYGLAVVNEVLSAILPGALLSAEISAAFLIEDATTMDSWGSGSLAMAVDVSKFSADIGGQVDRMIDTIRSSSPGTVLMPGEREAAVREQRIENGIPLAPDLLASLDRVFGDVGLKWR